MIFINHRFGGGSAAAMLLGLCFLSCGCTNKGAATGTASGTAAVKAPPGPGDIDCYKTAGAAACPSDPTGDSSAGKKLPMPGTACRLPVCSVCGSATAASFRDTTGTPKPGWCICVAKSDDSGVYIYSCFTPEEWSAQNR